MQGHGIGLQTVSPPDDLAASQFGRRSTRPRVDSAAGLGTEKWLLAYKLKALIFLKRDEIALWLHLQLKIGSPTTRFRLVPN